MISYSYALIVGSLGYALMGFNHVVATGFGIGIGIWGYQTAMDALNEKKQTKQQEKIEIKDGEYENDFTEQYSMFR